MQVVRTGTIWYGYSCDTLRRSELPAVAAGLKDRSFEVGILGLHRKNCFHFNEAADTFEDVGRGHFVLKVCCDLVKFKPPWGKFTPILITKMSAHQDDFSAFLKHSRQSFRDDRHTKRGLTLREMEERTGISFSRIGDLEAGRRCANEVTLGKLAAALNLEGALARDFVLRGLRASGTQKLPQAFNEVPSEVFEALLKEISALGGGAVPGPIRATHQHSECDLLWQAEDGRWFAMEIMTASGASPQEAVRKLREKIKRKAGKEPERPR